MDLQQALTFVCTQGIGILRIVYEHSPYDLEGIGIVLPKAKEYTKLADALLGPADSPRLQRESIALAEQRQLNLDHLVMVNRHAKKLKSAAQPGNCAPSLSHTRALIRKLMPTATDG